MEIPAEVIVEEKFVMVKTTDGQKGLGENFVGAAFGDLCLALVCNDQNATVYVRRKVRLMDKFWYSISTSLVNQIN